MNTVDEKIFSSYKDPSGYVFLKDGQIFRRINECYLDTYRLIEDSGLYHELIERRLLIEHDVVAENGDDNTHIVIQPRMIQFISYPYEWSFSQLKDAALATLEIQRIAISYGFTLKDAHGFNMQFYRGVPVLIDTLSFDRWDHTPWDAYRQFCESFLIPLALMRYRSPYLNTLLTRFLDGVPLEIGSELLPISTKLSLPIMLHIHLHAWRMKKNEKTDSRIQNGKSSRRFSEQSMLGLCMSLEKAISTLELTEIDSFWSTYYKSGIYSKEDFNNKRQFISEILEKQRPSVVWDMGCNNGEFSILAAKHSDLVIAIDNDHACVEQLYRRCKKEKITNILPLQMDLVNPSAALGWELQERQSLFERGRCDLVLALALVHHLCISANIPLEYLARFFGRISSRLIIEFITKEDQQVQILLQSRKDIFTSYHRDAFESAFGKYFQTIRVEELPGLHRSLYYMERI